MSNVKAINNTLTIIQSGRNLRSKKIFQSLSTDRDITVYLATLSILCMLSELEPVTQREAAATVTVITEELCQLWRYKMEELNVPVNEFDEQQEDGVETGPVLHATRCHCQAEDRRTQDGTADG